MLKTDRYKTLTFRTFKILWCAGLCLFILKKMPLFVKQSVGCTQYLKFGTPVECIADFLLLGGEFQNELFGQNIVLGCFSP